MAKLTFIELTKKILEEVNRPLTPEEIWEVARDKGYDKYMETSGKTPWRSIGAQLYVNIRDKSDSLFVKIDSRPKRFFLRSLVKNADIETLIEQQQPMAPIHKRFEYLESELHPFLAYYSYYYLKAYTKTIDHKKSGKGEFGEWLHPDMVGCYFPLDEWKPELVDFSSALGNISIKMFSFEIKRELNFSNLREYFFQTVSNSSWANEAYLAASEISENEDFRNELKRLSTSFGIGIIKLDIEDPDSSEIIFPARLKEYLDWDTMNKLAMNPDFKQFLQRIKIDISSKEIRKEKYDKILDKNDLRKTVRK